jgi:Glyoxalase/Bleomycin resistance protein/Dioxygenase superfamily
MNHIHYFPSDVPGIKAWYVKVDDLPGVNLTFPQTATAQLPTKGRAIDHIGFEVSNLEAFVRSLKALGIKIEAPIRVVPNTKVKVAFLTDPWGTYIELTEGLSPE